MKNRNNVLHQLDKMDNLANQLNFIVKSQQPIEDYTKLLDTLREVIDQTRSFVENEPQAYNN
jgi:hypothetical protein